MSTESVWIPVVGYGSRLREIRLQQGMTQDEFATAIGWPSGTYGGHETKVRPPRTGRWLAMEIQQVFNVPIEWTMTGVYNPEDSRIVDFVQLPESNRQNGDSDTHRYRSAATLVDIGIDPIAPHHPLRAA